MAEINKIVKEYWINTYKGSGKTGIMSSLLDYSSGGTKGDCF